MNEYILFLSIRSKLHTSQTPHLGYGESVGKRVHAEDLAQAIYLFQNTNLFEQFKDAYYGYNLYLRCYQSPSIDLIMPEIVFRRSPPLLLK